MHPKYVHDITHMLSRVITDVHVQLMITVDLWDYLLLRMHREVFGRMQGLQGRGGCSGGSCGVVSWHDDMEEQY